MPEAQTSDVPRHTVLWTSSFSTVLFTWVRHGLARMPKVLVNKLESSTELSGRRAALGKSQLAIGQIPG